MNARIERIKVTKEKRSLILLIGLATYSFTGVKQMVKVVNGVKTLYTRNQFSNTKSVREKKVFYSLYKKVDGKYFRCSTRAIASGRLAGLIFSGMIASDPLAYVIKPCPIELNEANIRFGSKLRRQYEN